MDQGRLTQGDIIRQLIALSGPLLLGNILQQLYNAVDAVIVGRFVGSTAFGAVGVAGSVMNLFLFLISGGCDGVGTLLAQFCGGDNRSAFRREFFLSGIFGAGASLVLTALGLLALEPLLALLRTPDSVAVCARAYLQIIFLGFPAAFAFHLSSRVLRAVGNTRAGLAFLALSMGVNLALDLVLVAGLSMGVQGAALATVLAQALAALLCGGYLRLRFPQLMFGREDMVLDLPLLRRTARFSAVTALHMCNLYIGKLLVQGAVNSLGEEAINAFTAATRVEGFANSFGDSGAEATAIFTGQNTGAGQGGRVREGFRRGQRLLLGLGAFMSLVMLLWAEPCLRLVLPAGSPLGPGAGYLRTVACFYVFNFLGSGLAGYFRGRGRVSLPVIGATGHISLRVLLSFLLTPAMGLPAVGLATGLGWMGVVTFWYILAGGDLRRAAGAEKATLENCAQ